MGLGELQLDFNEPDETKNETSKSKNKAPKKTRFQDDKNFTVVNELSRSGKGKKDLLSTGQVVTINVDTEEEKCQFRILSVFNATTKEAKSTTKNRGMVLAKLLHETCDVWMGLLSPSGLILVPQKNVCPEHGLNDIQKKLQRKLVTEFFDKRWGPNKYFGKPKVYGEVLKQVRQKVSTRVKKLLQELLRARKQQTAVVAEAASAKKKAVRLQAELVKKKGKGGSTGNTAEIAALRAENQTRLKAVQKADKTQTRLEGELQEAEENQKRMKGQLQEAELRKSGRVTDILANAAENQKKLDEARVAARKREDDVRTATQI